MMTSERLTSLGEDESGTRLFSNQSGKIFVKKTKELVMCSFCTNMIPANKIICGECAANDGFKEEAM